MHEEEFIDIAKKKAIIKQLQSEVNETEKIIKTTFYIDVKEFFLFKGYEFEDKLKNDYSSFIRFKDVRQKDQKNTFTTIGTPRYIIAGKNHLIVRFEWHLVKNSNWSSTYWYPEKQTLEDFYNRRLKKVFLLPIKIERKNKINKINKEKL